MHLEVCNLLKYKIRLILLDIPPSMPGIGSKKLAGSSI